MRRIVLFGASGYTGGRVAAAMVGRGLRPVLLGRDDAKLAALSERLGGLETTYADVADRTSLFEAIRRDDVLVSTVGPFHKMGWVAVRAAVDAGAIYLVSSGEPPFIRSVHEWFGPEAEGTGAALLTAFGHDYVPGVLAGALALRDAGPGAERVDVGYYLTGRGRLFSRGTLFSMLGIALEPGFAFRRGELRDEPAGTRMRTFAIDGTPRPALSVGASEQFALPRLASQLRSVDVYLGWFGRASRPLHAASGLTATVGRVRTARTAAWIAADYGTRRVPAAPAADALAGASVHVVAEVFDATGRLLARTRLRAPEAYGLTAELLAWGAGRAAEHGVEGVGALDAVSAFGLDEVMKGAADAGIIVEA
ncbi:MAG: NAD(P)H-binding protein [Pseudonocardia sp.]|nr:NAD(P)H-binding protein [Pseudonocardia sp.]